MQALLSVLTINRHIKQAMELPACCLGTLMGTKHHAVTDGIMEVSLRVLGVPKKQFLEILRWESVAWKCMLLVDRFPCFSRSREPAVVVTERNSQFATTQWTLVWNAASSDAHDSQPALEEIVRRYWQPLYFYARRRGMSLQDAEDATQEFLSSVIHGQLLASADPAKGKFRAFLLTAWKRFLVDQYRKRSTERRGGSVSVVSLDYGTGERRWQELSSREPDPDRVFMQSWAGSLLDEVRQRLQADYARRNRSEILAALFPRITESLTAENYLQLAEQLDTTASAVKVAMHRLRQRFAQMLRDVVLETIDDPSDIEHEIGELLSAIAGRDR